MENHSSHEYDTNPNTVAEELGVKEAATALAKALGRVARVFFFGTAEQQASSRIKDIPSESIHNNTSSPTILKGKTTGVVDREHLKRIQFLGSIGNPKKASEDEPDKKPQFYDTPGVVDSRKRDELRRLP